MPAVELLTRADAHRAALTLAYNAIVEARVELLASDEYGEADKHKMLFWVDEIIENLRRKLATVGTL